MIYKILLYYADILNVFVLHNKSSQTFTNFFFKRILFFLRALLKNQSIGLVNFLWKDGSLLKKLHVFSSFATKWNTSELLIGWNAVMMVTASLIYWFFKKNFEHDITLNNSRLIQGHMLLRRRKKNVLKSFWMTPRMEYHIS